MAVVVVALVASGARTLWPASPSVVAAPPANTPSEARSIADPVSPATAPAGGFDAGQPAPSTADPGGETLSEADLMAIEGDDAALSAAAHAAWFVSEYFTLDGTDRADVASRLPLGIALPPVDATARSFVESAEPVTVTRVSPSRFEIVVVVRALSGLGEAGYERDPDRAVAVTVELGPEGGAIVDLPTPVPLPAAPAPALALEPAQAPPAVGQAAVAAASVWGTARIESAARVGDVWRVLLTVTTESGVSWPLVVRLDESGTPVLASLGAE